MNTTWIKPNLRGILLFIALFLIILNFIPSTTVTYSLPEGKPTESGTWWWIVSFRQRCIAAFFGGDTSEIAA
jgi:hypothetical protein